MAIKTEPNWAEVTNLAVSAAGLHKLSTLQNTVEKSYELEVAKQRSEEIQNKLRQFLFGLEHAVEQVSLIADTNPSGAMLLLWATELSLANSGVTAERFNQFCDKDRLRDFQRRLSSAVDDMRSKTGDNGQEAEACRRYLADWTRLQSLIDRLERLESAKRNLEQHRTSMNQLRSEIERATARHAVAVRATKKAIVISALVGTATGSMVGVMAGIPLGVIIGVVMALAAALILFSYRPEAEPEKLRRLQASLSDCEKHIRYAETPIESAFEADFAYFGVRSLADLKEYNKAQWQRVLATAPWDSKQLSAFVAMFAESR